MKNKVLKTLILPALLLTSTVYPQTMNTDCTTGSQNQGGGNMNSSKSVTADPSWQTLFNGKDLEGWEVKCDAKDKDKGFWTVDEGTILCNSLHSTDHNYVWLQSKEEYGDFELRLKFQVSRSQTGNSGVQFRSRYDDNAIVEEGITGWMDGPQADIEPNDPWRIGLIYDETREAKRWINPSLPNWQISEEGHAPEKTIFYYEDEGSGWNDMSIICKGMHIQITVNNILVSYYDGTGVLDDEAHKMHNVGEKGHIAFQLHKYSRNMIRFRDIVVRKIE